MIVRRSRKYNFVPTSVGTVQARFFSTLTFEITFNSVGVAVASARLPSSSRIINFPSARTKFVFGVFAVNVPVRNPATIRLSADVGGTFTDVAAFDVKTGELTLGKTLTTPERLVTG